MNKVWFIGDTHFGHNNIITLSETRSRFKDVEEHDRFLVDSWNSVVNKGDKVYHLGDLAFNGKSMERFVPQLYGNITLVLGNHDRFDVDSYKRVGIKKIVGCMRYDREFVLTHVPIHPSQLEYRWGYNIHGHIHDPSKYSLGDKYINVNACVRDLTPVCLEKILEELK